VKVVATRTDGDGGCGVGGRDWRGAARRHSTGAAPLFAPADAKLILRIGRLGTWLGLAFFAPPRAWRGVYRRRYKTNTNSPSPGALEPSASVLDLGVGAIVSFRQLVMPLA
jgi:hypothetical protein